MTDNELRELVEIGRQAEEFNAYLSDHPYFDMLLDRIKLELMKQMCELVPTQMQEFSSIMTRIQFVPEIRNAISGDIYMASEAWKELEGIRDDGGLL